MSVRDHVFDSESSFDDAETLLENAGFHLLSLHRSTRSGSPFYQVVFHKHGGVSLDDCVAVQRLLEPRFSALEGKRALLEVQSGGAVRTLKRWSELSAFKGERLCVSVKGAEKKSDGVLCCFNAESLTLDLGESGETELAKDDILKVSYQPEGL